MRDPLHIEGFEPMILDPAHTTLGEHIPLKAYLREVIQQNVGNISSFVSYRGYAPGSEFHYLFGLSIAEPGTDRLERGRKVGDNRRLTSQYLLDNHGKVAAGVVNAQVFDEINSVEMM